MGYVGDHLTLAGGGDYGDETVSQSLCFMKKNKELKRPNQVKDGCSRWKPCMGGTGDEAGFSKLPGKSTQLLSRAKIDNFPG